MATPKCRLEVWKPKIRIVEADGNLLGLYEPARWVACETHENIPTNQRRGNALESVSITDGVFEPQYASMRLTNRPQDFKAYNEDVYKHVYKDSDGMEIPDYPSYPGTLEDGEVYLRKRWGVFTNFFYEFQHIRLVDLETHLVLFAGRITKITKRYEDGNGSIIQLQARDALNEIANVTTSALVRKATFTASTHRRSDLIKYLLNLSNDYEGKQPATGPLTDVSIDADDITTIANSSTGTFTNEDIGTSDAINQYSRFERSAQPFGRNIDWNCEATGTKHVLAEIARWSMLDPHNSNTSERAFGYDLFMDANYGKHNLDATIGPGVTGFNAPHFNYFKRGNRLSAAGGAGQDAAVYGLTVKYPTLTTANRVGATAINVGDLSESINASVTTFETSNNGIVPGIQIQIDSEYMYVKQVMPDVTGGGGGDELEVIRGFASTTAASHTANADISNPRSAQTIMQRGFNFEDSKEDLYTDAVLIWDAQKDRVFDGSGNQKQQAPLFKEKRMEIMYVTEVAYGDTPNNTSQFNWEGTNIDAERQQLDSLGKVAEKVDAYNLSGSGIGSAQALGVARIQYQSHPTLTGSTNFAFILLSDITSDFPSSNYGSDDYIYLRGQESHATCRLNLSTGLSEAHEGRPSKVWGSHRVLDMGQMSDVDNTDLRHEIAAKLAQATTGLRQGGYSFSKAPYYWWDGLVHSVGVAAAGVSFGQDITVKNVNDSTAVNITNFGVREGMLVHKMTANHASIAQNGDSNDVYGYIGDMQDNQTIAVRLNVRNSAGGSTLSTFSVGDPIRIIIPLRAGTEVFVDNAIAEIYGEHIISEINYNEDPMPETRITSVGKNETRLGGGHRVKGLISQLAQTTLATREKTQKTQPPLLGNYFGRLVITLPNGSEAHTALKATWSSGSYTTINGLSFNFAAGSTAVSTYGLGGNMTANQHYIVYLDPDGENLGGTGTYHLYTKRVGTYTRDSDNIPIFHIIATATAGIAKPIIRLQPNVYLDHTEAAGGGTISFTNEAGATIDLASIKTELIADLAIDTAQLAADAVERAKIEDGAINADKIEARSITADRIVANAITTNEVNFTPGNQDSTATIRAVAAATSGTVGGSVDIDHETGTLASLEVTAATLYIGDGTFSHANTPFFVRGADGGGGTAGDFSLGSKLIWDDSASTLTIDGAGTFSGALSAATGTFAGTLSAASGTFGGSLSSATGTFSGALTAASGTFAGSISLSSGTVVLNNDGLSLTTTDASLGGQKLHFKVSSSTVGFISAASGNFSIASANGVDMSIGSPAGGGGGGTTEANTDTMIFYCKDFRFSHGGSSSGARYAWPGGTPADDKVLAVASTSGNVTQLEWATASGGSSGNHFTTIEVSGTDLDAVGDDTLVMTSANSVIGLVGNSGADSITFTGNAFRLVTAGGNTLTATGDDTLNFVNGAGISIVGNTSTDTITISYTGESSATTSSEAHTTGSHSHDLASGHDGSHTGGTNNYVAAFTATNILQSATSARTATRMYVNNIYFNGTSPYCGSSTSPAYQVRTGRLYTTDPNVYHENLGTNSSSTNYLKVHNTSGLVTEVSSTRKVKENIVDLTIDTSKLYDLVPRNFKFKDQLIEVFNDETEETTSYTEVGENSFGMIAEEVNEILPELVVLDKNQEPKSIDYPLLSVLLLAELKKMKTRIEALENNG